MGTSGLRDPHRFQPALGSWWGHQQGRERCVQEETSTCSMHIREPTSPTNPGVSASPRPPETSDSPHAAGTRTAVSRSGLPGCLGSGGGRPVKGNPRHGTVLASPWGLLGHGAGSSWEPTIWGDRHLGQGVQGVFRKGTPPPTHPL